MNRYDKRLPVAGLACTFILFPLSAQAYIDPGTGSLLLQGLIGAVAGVMVAASLYWSKIKHFFRKDQCSPGSAPGQTDPSRDDPSAGSPGGSSALPAEMGSGEARARPQAQMDAQAQVQARAQVHAQTQIKEPEARLDPDRHHS